MQKRWSRKGKCCNGPFKSNALATSRIEEAQRTYSDAYNVFFAQTINIAALRKTVKAGVPIAEEATLAFLNKGFEEQQQNSNFGFDSSLSAKSTSESLAKQGSMTAGAAYLVFTHSIVDALLFKLIRVVSLLKPEAWEYRLNKQLSLKDIKEKSFNELRESLLDKHLEEVVNRAPIVVKAELILKFCGSPTKAAFLANYTFNKSKLEEANNLRRQTVHGAYLGQLIPNANQRIEY